MSLVREKKKKQLSEAMKEAGVGKGIKGAIKGKNVDLSSARTGVSKEVARNIGRKMASSESLSEARTGGLQKRIIDLGNKSDLSADEKRRRDLKTKSTSQLMQEAEGRWKKSFGRGYTPKERQGAWEEITTGKKYGDVSPIRRGNFNQYTPKKSASTSTLTQDDADRKKLSEMYRQRRTEIKRKK